MADIKSQGSRFLAVASPRLLVPINASIIVQASKGVFHVAQDGTPDTTSITFSAALLLLDGTVSWTCSGGTLSNIVGNTATLTYSNMSADVATITATLLYRGQSYNASTTVTKLFDNAGNVGPSGLNNAIVYAYQRSATALTSNPGAINYSFSAGITTPTLQNGWSKTIPSGSDPLYVTTASASASTATDTIASNEWSSPVVLAQNGTQGLSVATIYIYQRTTSLGAPSLPSATATYTFSNGNLANLNNGWTSVIPTAGGAYLYVSTATAASTTGTDDITSTEWAAAQILAQNGTQGQNGSAGASTGVANLFQWSTVTPSLPTGTATFSWATAAVTAYSDNDGWSVAIPANPGSPGIKLWQASKPVTAPAGTVSTGVTFASGSSLAAISLNGAQGVAGVKTAVVYAYQWGLSAPTTTGSATYNWTAGTYDNPPVTGWTQNKTNAPGNGYTLYEASVRLVETTSANTTSINWTTATVAGIAFLNSAGGAGSQGASARIAYTLVDGFTLAQSPSFYTAPGQTYPGGGVWGETRAWQSTPPTPAAGQSVFQTDGIFDPVPNQTVWNVPYLSNLKVGNLSAISANFGQMTAGSIDIGSGLNSWHVDSLGNTWAGASSFGAAPYRVSNSGSVVANDIVIQDKAGNVVLRSDSSLASQTKVNKNVVPRLRDWTGARVGGASYLYNAADQRSINGEFIFLPPSTTGVYVGYESAPTGILANETYTVSFDASSAGLIITVQLFGTNVNSTGKTVNVTAQNSHYSFTETMPPNATGDARVRVYTVSNGQTAIVSNFKVEYGVKETSWVDNVITPANISTFMANASIGGVLIADQAVTARTIAAQAVTADKILVNTLQAISSVVIARVNGQGAGVDMDQNGARVYDGNSIRRFQWGNLDV
jgi:hypothetical protein